MSEEKPKPRPGRSHAYGRRTRNLGAGAWLAGLPRWSSLPDAAILSRAVRTGARVVPRVSLSVRSECCRGVGARPAAPSFQCSPGRVPSRSIAVVSAIGAWKGQCCPFHIEQCSHPHLPRWGQFYPTGDKRWSLAFWALDRPGDDHWLGSGGCEDRERPHQPESGRAGWLSGTVQDQEAHPAEQADEGLLRAAGLVNEADSIPV